MLGEPLERLLARRIEDDAALVHEHDAVAAGKRASRTLLGDENGARQVLDQVEEGFRPVRVELRRRFVQQQEAWSQCERRGERYALQLSAGQLTGEPMREWFRTDESQGFVHPRPDLVGRHADVLEAEGDLVRHLGHHDLILRILEHRGDEAGELRRSRLPRVDARRRRRCPRTTPPWKCGTSPASARKSVDFPDPDGPSNATCSPSPISSDTSSRTRGPAP